MSCKNPIICRITQILSNFTRFQPNMSSRVAFITQIVYFQLSKHVNKFRRYLYFRFTLLGVLLVLQEKFMIKSWFPVLRNLFTVSSTLYEYERYQTDCFSRRSTEQDVFLLLREFQHFMLYNFDSRFQNSLLWIIFGYWINILNTL